MNIKIVNSRADRIRRTDRMKRAVQRFRMMGKGFFFPLIVIYLLQPLYLLASRSYEYGGYGIDYIQDAARAQMLFLYPPLCLYWPYRLLSRYLEEEGREIEYLYSRNKWPDIFDCYAAWLLALLPPHIIYGKILQDMETFVFLYIFICAVCFAYCGIAYWLAYFTGSALVILPVAMFYSFMVCTPYVYGLESIDYTSLFYKTYVEQLLNCCLLFAIGGVFALLGQRHNRRYQNYP